MKFLGGIVWWNEVSNTATCGVLGKMFSMARIPFRLAGLCSGASSKHASIFCLTALSTTALSLKYSPPWATRWPTAAISEMLSSTPCSGSTSASRIRLIPEVWSGMLFTISYLDFPVGLWVSIASERPIRSTIPFTSSV